jgi:hypothetical protein
MTLDLSLVRGGTANSSKLMKKAQIKFLINQLSETKLSDF